MQLKKLLQDDDAVSPVIGVILMVAITVILAAVIASFVLGMGQQNDPAPTATIGMDYEKIDPTNSSGALTIAHESGETISPANLYVRGDEFVDMVGEPYDETNHDMTWDNNPDVDAWDMVWVELTSADGVSDNYVTESEVSSGKKIVMAVNSDYDVSVVWESPEGDTSTTLNEQSGPDA